MADFRRKLMTLGGLRPFLKRKVADQLLKEWLLFPYLRPEQRQLFSGIRDPFRYAAIFLALEDIVKRGIQGSLAECGVYQGATSKFIHDVVPDRLLYLFDTFEGFELRDSNTIGDDRFRDTSAEAVLERVGTTKNIIVKKGYFPETARGLEAERFAFVMLDFDKFDPTMAGMEFFYPRMSPGGFIFIHDYNSPESQWACSKAVEAFLEGKPEKPIGIPDAAGTALIRKC